MTTTAHIFRWVQKPIGNRAVDEPLLHRGKPISVSETSDRGDRSTVHGDRRSQARPHTLIIEMYGAGAALAMFETLLCSSQRDDPKQRVKESGPRTGIVAAISDDRKPAAANAVRFVNAVTTELVPSTRRVRV